MQSISTIPQDGRAEGKQPSILHLSSRMFWCGESNRILVECRGLQEAGWEVLLGAPSASAIARRGRELNVPVHDSLHFRRGLRLWHLFKDVLNLRRLQRERSFDVAHLHTSVDMWIAVIAFMLPFKGKKPLLVRTRHSDHESKGDVVHRWLYRRALDHIVFSADALRKPMAKIMRSGAIREDKLSVIHSSVNVHRFNPDLVSGDLVRREFNLENCFCIGLVGRVSKEKGHLVLLEALKGMHKPGKQIRCFFAGEGVLLESLRKTSREWNMANQVVFAGFRSDIPEIMAAMDIVVVPSTRVESSPGVVKEGMAMGKVVVASSIGGVAEIIDDGVDGVVIAPGSSQALKDALSKLIDQPDMRNNMAGRARSKVVGSFSDEHLVERSMALYQRIVRC